MVWLLLQLKKCLAALKKLFEAKPNLKNRWYFAPVFFLILTIRTKKIYCANCRTLLYKYRKAKEGHLVKCFKDQIKDDYTNADRKCQKCGTRFALEQIYNGHPANKIIQRKLFMK